MKKATLPPSLIIALIIVIVTCGDGATATPVPQINQVSFEAFDYGFTGPDTIPSGMTTITMVNAGQELHRQQLISLAEGMSAEDLLAALAEGEPEDPPPLGLRPLEGSPFSVPE